MKNTIKTLWKLTSGKTEVQIRHRTIRASRNAYSLILEDITDGGKTGKQAVKASISNLERGYTYDAFETAIEWFSILLDMFLSNEYPNHDVHITLQGLECRASLKKAYRLLNEANLKPLAEIPVRWSLRQVARVLANQQYEPGSFQCDGHYTDDYAYDAAVNFGKGPTSHKRLLTDLVEDPSGYKTWADDQRVHVACHYFLYYSFIPSLEPAS